MYPKPDGTTNDRYEHHIAGAELEQWYLRRPAAALFASYKVATDAVKLTHPICGAAPMTANNQQCAGLSMTVNGDLTPVANALAQGAALNACFNIPTNPLNRPHYTASDTANNSWCYILPRPPVPTPVLAEGGSLPHTTLTFGRYYVAPNGILSYYSGASASVTTDDTCTTSGHCSITFTSLPQVPNAIGWALYANIGGMSWWQYSSGDNPIPIGTDLTIGESAHPSLQQSIAATVTVWSNTASSRSPMFITGVDVATHTIYTDGQLNASQPTATGYAPSQPLTGSTIFIVRAGGIVADAGTNSSTIVCNSCNFSSVQFSTTDAVNQSDIAYCGVTVDPQEAVYSNAPSRGSLILSVTNGNTLNLVTPINCAPGTNFEIRRRRGGGGANRIFVWTNAFYDLWKRENNHITGDAILWMAARNNPSGSGGALAGNPSFGSAIGLRREDALAMTSCRHAMHVSMDTGGNSPFPTGPWCNWPVASQFQDIYPTTAFQRVDTMVHNGIGNGSGEGSFLNGLIAFSIAQWWLDPLMNAQSDTRYVYWIKKLADFLWPYYEAANSRNPNCYKFWPREWSYIIDAPLLGIACGPGTNSNLTLNGQALNDYWSIYGNLIPTYAFLYWWTGNGVIPTANTQHPPTTTYGDAYTQMFSWLSVYMATMAPFINPAAGYKTLGEMGIWQDQAIGWMRGNGGTTPPPTTGPRQSRRRSDKSRRPRSQ